jgi:hypothetical protein
LSANIPSDESVRQRAVNYIREHWGNLNDLPKPLIPVIWVTVYRSLETAMLVEANGGSKALLKDTLVGERQLAPRFEEATLCIKFLQEMILIIRKHKSARDKLVDSYLLIDILKWKIFDASSMSGIERTIRRQFAKAGIEYNRPIPDEIMF